MNLTDVLAVFDQDQRINIEYPDMRKDILPQVIRFVAPRPRMSFVLHSHLDEQTADAVIAEQIAYFQQLNQSFEWKVYVYDTPADLRDRLVAHGFTAEPPDAIMVLDLQNTPDSLLTPITADVRHLTSLEAIRDAIRVEEQVWGGNFDWMTNRLGSHLEIPGHLSLYVAYVDNEPASTGWIYFHPGSEQFASLWGGSTVERFRGRGLYTALLATRVQEARQRGYHYLTIDASPMSRPIVARHGFQLLTYAHACEWKPGEA